ncbi:MAG: acyl-CoA synthetase [Ilumatobacter sp.]|nr:MAG: acyl-CoA synthetase [Ilumatobacter sp.]
MTDTPEWNIADVYEAIAAHVPDHPCQIQGDRVVTWGEFDRRASAVAADLVAAGLGHQAKVACYLHNGPEYLEVVVAAFKAALAPVNTNYRYGADEIAYLFDNADAEAVVFHASFTDLLAGIRERLTKVVRWYVVADHTGPGPDWAVPYESVATSGATLEPGSRPRSGDDLLLLYTGGTTGMPKGVMWRQDDLFNVLGASGNAVAGVPPATSLDEVLDRIDTTGASTPVMVVACPLMHGTGQFSALIAMTGGGAVVSLASRHFDVEELFTTIEQRRATNLVIVGQAFAGPMLEHLEAHPGRYDLSSLNVISSSGVMWSHDNKAGLLRHIPQVVLFDSFGSSEAVGLGGSVSAAGMAEQTATFAIGPNNAVFTDDDRRVEPGSGEMGMIAVGGFIPVGYYKDPEKSARTFRQIEGRRWSIPGDFATVNDDGTIHLLGRGSVCINTGGEKVFPEEVEEALKTHPSVRDAVVVGLPDERFGETICAVVEASGASPIDAGELRDHVTSSLAAYKAPRSVVTVDSIARAANGKVDYARLKQVAADRLGP